MDQAPSVVKWVKIYEVVFALVYLMLVAVGIAYLLGSVSSKPDEPPPGVMGAIYLVIGVPLAALFGIAPFTKPTAGTWVLHIVCIAIGLTSCLCMPAAIPLLIFWLKPETKAHFGRT